LVGRAKIDLGIKKFVGGVQKKIVTMWRKSKATLEEFLEGRGLAPVGKGKR